MDESSRQRYVTEAVAARARAEVVLRELIAASAECESHLTQQSRVDSMRLVTGKTSLENAINETRRIIDVLDRAIEDADRLDPGLLASLSATFPMPGVFASRSSVA